VAGMTSRVRALAVGALACLAVLLGLPATAWADHTVGYDVSYPQCGTDLPEDAAFAVVGVNGGRANRPNPCLAEQLEWAAGASGQVRGQPRVQLYVNTANPGHVLDQVRTWPLSGRTPYGRCGGDNDLACSWQYGWLRAWVDVHAYLAPAAEDAGLDPDPAVYRWWLDVETLNTWQAPTPVGQARNRAALEGMAAYLSDQGAEVGLYSTSWQWGRIAGAVPPESPLTDLDSWLAGASSAEDAAQACGRRPLVPGGRVRMVQFVDHDLDHDVPCR
jgi:hypothetical protein